MNQWKSLLGFFLLIIISGCSTPQTMRDLSENYATVRGRMVAPPSIQPHRLFLYIQIDPLEGQTAGNILVCVAENKEKDQILQQLSTNIVEADKPLFLLGSPVKGAWNEYAEGIDFEVYAVGYYNPKAQKYQTVITTYGDRVQDVVSSIGWGNLLKAIGRKALDTAL